MESEKEIISKEIEIVERNIEEGNSEIYQLWKCKVINQDKLIAAWSKKGMEVEWKLEVAEEMKTFVHFLSKKFALIVLIFFKKVIIFKFRTVS